MTTDSDTRPATAAQAAPAAWRAQTDTFATSPALARTADGGLWLAYLAFDGEAERVRLARARDAWGAAWHAARDVSAPGLVFPPALGAAGSRLWTFWTARDPGTAPPEQATCSLWARALAPAGEHGGETMADAVRLAGGSAAAGRPLAPRVAAAPDGALWLAYEVWEVGEGASSTPCAAEQPATRWGRR